MDKLVERSEPYTADLELSGIEKSLSHRKHISFEKDSCINNAMLPGDTLTETRNNWMGYDVWESQC